MSKLISIEKIDSQKAKVKCSCGKEYITWLSNAKRNVNGCLRCHNKKHAHLAGITHNKSRTREYRVWWDMLNRCNKPNTKRYKDYGGRGITVCQQWIDSFQSFFNDMGERPSKNHSLDRIDNNGNYCKENCKWSSRQEQYRNRRTNIFVIYIGEKRILTDACSLAGFKLNNVTSYKKRNNITDFQKAFEAYHQYRDRKFISENLQ